MSHLLCFNAAGFRLCACPSEFSWHLSFSTDQKFSQFEEKINLTRNVQSSNIFVIIFQNSLHKVQNCTIYPDLFKWKEMDTSPYLSGGLCRMTKHTARWSTHGSQSGNRCLHSAFLHCAADRHQNAPLAPHTGYKLCVLYSVRHSPQLREYFILLSWTASYSLTFEHVHCFHGPRRWIWFGCNAACSIVALLHCIGFPLQCTCVKLLLIVPVSTSCYQLLTLPTTAPAAQL